MLSATGVVFVVGVMAVVLPTNHRDHGPHQYEETRGDDDYDAAAAADDDDDATLMVKTKDGTIVVVAAVKWCVPDDGRHW